MLVPYVDIFAGPGGLGEGFSRFASFTRNDVDFEARLSIEKDPVAAQTLTLRTFTHQFRHSGLPNVYYGFIRGEVPASDLCDCAEWDAARSRVWNVELGQLEEAELHHRIRNALAGARNWILLGGPPCQAYSLAGRSRMTGLGSLLADRELDQARLQELGAARLEEFYSDHRHRLYREYLRIVAVHQPPVFVMENVKGILSARLPDPAIGGVFRGAFKQIRADLSDPWKALEGDALYDQLDSFRREGRFSYRLYSFVVSPVDQEATTLDDRGFLIRAGEYGIPQSRHRVIILGVREDINVTPTTLAVSSPVSVRQAIGDLPPLRSGVSKGKDSPSQWLRALRTSLDQPDREHLARIGILESYEKLSHRATTNLSRGRGFQPFESFAHGITGNLSAWLEDERIGGFIQHETRTHMPSDLRRYLFASLSTDKFGKTPKLSEWPEGLLPEHVNVRDPYTEEVMIRGFEDRFRVQAWDQPATTITSHISKDGHYYIHPDPEQCRSLTVREAARLQTFPDNYFFAGGRTHQYHQVGNAVPPFLSVQLAEVVADLFERAQISG